ncbi:MAG: hypothetical protein ABW217_02970 [Polyangiaceae bacterium]
MVAGASLLVAVVMLGNRPRKTVQPPKSPPPDYEKNMERRFVTPNELEWPTDARMRLSLRDPQPRTEDDDIFDAWVRDPRSGAPALTDEDLNPEAGKRRISAVERWLLAPYFPVSEDLDDRWIVNGYEPPPLGGTIPVNLYAWAEPAEDGGAKDGYVVFPNETRNLINRWWISCLAHELWHLAQARIGLTPAQTVAAFRRWGYVDSPIEVQARWQQKRVFDGVTAAAREFFDLA